MNATPHRRGRVVLLGVSILALAAVAVVVGQRATAADDHGNTPQTATPVQLNAPALGALGSFGDKDWFVLQGGAPVGALRLVASGNGFAPRVEVYNGNMLRIGTYPGAGTQMSGPFSFSATLPGAAIQPVYVQVLVAGRLGSYSIVLQGTASGDGPKMGNGDPPTAPGPKEGGPLDPLPLPPPPPEPPSLTDDVPDGTEIDLSTTFAFDGRIEIPGDNDFFVFTAPVAGDYELRLLSTEVVDGEIVGRPPHDMHIGVWFPTPTTATWGVGEEVHLLVHGLSEYIGAYRIEITPPVGTPPPAPPPVPDVALAFDPVQGMFPKASREYANWVFSNYRLQDPSVNLEGVGALALRDRWIRRDRGAALKTAYADPTGAITGALAGFGGKNQARLKYPPWLTQQRALVLPGGGGLDLVRQTVADGVAHKRPLVLLGKHVGDGKVEAWVVYGLKTVGSVLNLMVVDPSAPGQAYLLPLDAGGVRPVNGAQPMLEFVLLGHLNDVLPFP